MGVGTLQATNARMAAATAASVESLWQWVLLQSHVHVDESPWPVMGLKEWLWVVTGRQFCLFHAGDTRSRNELEVMLGTEFQGILSSDDFSVYNGYQVLGQQKCLAHLRRHFKKVIKLGHGNNPILGQAFLDLIDEANACAPTVARDSGWGSVPRVDGIIQTQGSPKLATVAGSSRVCGRIAAALTTG